MIVDYLTESADPSIPCTQEEKERIRHELSFDVPSIISDKDVFNNNRFLKALKNRLLYWLNKCSEKPITFDCCKVWGDYHGEDSLLIKEKSLHFLNFDTIGITLYILSDQYQANKEAIDALEDAFHRYTWALDGHYYYAGTENCKLSWNSNDRSIFGSWLCINYNTKEDIPRVIASIDWDKFDTTLRRNWNTDISRKEIGPLLTDALIKAPEFEKIYNFLLPIIDDFFLEILDK